MVGVFSFLLRCDKCLDDLVIKSVGNLSTEICSKVANPSKYRGGQKVEVKGPKKDKPSKTPFEPG